MAFTPITVAESDAKSPISESLWAKVRENFDDHEARILALEAGGGGGGSGAIIEDEKARYATVLSGLEDDTAKFWRRRFGIFQNIINGNPISTIEGFDPEGKDSGETWIGLEQQEDQSTGWTISSDGRYYNGEAVVIPKDSKFSFRLKKGLNFFGIGYHPDPTASDNVEVFVDGQTPTALGLLDEKGSPAPDAFSSVASTAFFGAVKWYFNLDPSKEHVVKIFNNDSGADVFPCEFIELGFASKPGEFSPDLTLKVGTGRINVRGTTVNVDEANLSFSPTGYFGRTDAIKVNTAGVLSVLEGIEPAFSQAAPEVAIAFSAGAPSTLKLKNVNTFPTQGFILVQNEFGAKFLASYTGKTGDLLGSLTGMVWHSAPSEDYTPLSGFNSIAQANASHDLSVNLWAGGGIKVEAGVNDKIDFDIFVNGVQTNHSATVAPGLYSADMGPTIQEAIIASMNTAKDLSGINGQYFVEYNSESHRFTIGAFGDEIDSINFDNNTGPNTATNLLKSLLGFDNTDITGSNSYLADNEVEALAARVYRIDDNFIDAQDPRVKYESAPSTTLGTEQEDVEGRLGFSTIYRQDGSQAFCRFTPDHEAAGVIFATIYDGEAPTYCVSVDNGDVIYALNPNGLAQQTLDASRASVATYFLPFPKGSHQIAIWPTNESQHRMNTAQDFYVLGFRQLFTKPADELLATDEAIVRSIERAPVSQYRTFYESDYSHSTNDNIDGVSQSGTWTNGLSNQSFNRRDSFTTSVGDYEDITFTIQGIGGIGIISQGGSNGCRKASYYLKAGAVGSNAAADLVGVHFERMAADINEMSYFRLYNLPAGQYTLRKRHEDNTGANLMIIEGIEIVDEVLPERKVVTSAVTNTGQSVSEVLHGKIHMFQIDSTDRVPGRLLRSGYDKGIAVVDHFINNNSLNDSDDVSTVRVFKNYFSNNYRSGGTHQNNFARVFGFCRGISYRPYSFSNIVVPGTVTGSITPTIDGVNEAANIDCSKQLKGGDAPAQQYFGDNSLYSRRFREPLSGTPGSSTVFPVADTRGFVVGMTVLLKDDSEPDLRRTITAITTDVNVTFSEAVTNFANYGTVSNSYIESPAFHVLSMVNNQNFFWYFGTAMLEQLPLLPSDNEARVFAKDDFVSETKTILFRNVVNGDDLYYPIFSNGRSATWQETSIQIVKVTHNAGNGDYLIDNSLKNISVNGNTSLTIKLTAVRSF